MRNDRYLLIDSRVVDYAQNAAVVLAPAVKEPTAPFLMEEQEVEGKSGSTNMYSDVIYDTEDKLYKLWYSVYGGTRYAFSRDGLAWECPSLGLFDVGGSKDNNVVIETGGKGVLKDPRDPDPQRRYKMIYKSGARSTEETRAAGRHARLWMWMAYSPDGIHWTTDEQVQMPRWRGAHGDTHNMLYFDERLGKYVAFLRLWDVDHGFQHYRDTARRTVGRMVSDDCRVWSFPDEVLTSVPGEHWDRQPHDFGVMPCAGGYIGLLTIVNPREGEYSMDNELLWSHDSIVWQHICPGQSLIPRGAAGSFDSMMVCTTYMPIIHDDEMRIYYIGHSKRMGKGRGGLGLAYFKPYRFAGYKPKPANQKGLVVTRHLECTGRNLYVNAAGGTVRVGLVSHWRYDHDGDITPDRGGVVTGDLIDGRVVWPDGMDLSHFVGYSVRLHFELDGATLYSFRMADD